MKLSRILEKKEIYQSEIRDSEDSSSTLSDNAKSSHIKNSSISLSFGSSNKRTRSSITPVPHNTPLKHTLVASKETNLINNIHLSSTDTGRFIFSNLKENEQVSLTCFFCCCLLFLILFCRNFYK